MIEPLLMLIEGINRPTPGDCETVLIEGEGVQDAIDRQHYFLSSSASHVVANARAASTAGLPAR